MGRLVTHFTNLGYEVFVLPEVPSILLGTGINLGALDLEAFISFEQNLIQMQISLEDIFIDQAKRSDKPTLILCDRGTMDPSAYMNAEMWDNILSSQGWTSAQLRDDRYDAVIHLVSAAIGAPEFYTTENNEVRLETPEQAAELDHKVLASWKAHPNHQVIDNSTGFDEKIRKVIEAISRGIETV
jgi:predicted ATPase